MILCKRKSGRAFLTTSGLCALTAIWLAFAGLFHAHLPYNISWEVETLVDLSFGCVIGFVFCPTLLRQLEWNLELKSLGAPLAVGLLVQFLVISIITQSKNERGIWLGLVVVVLAPISEETLARGMFLHSLTELKPQDWITWVLLVSLFMAIMHHWFWLALVQQSVLCVTYLKPRPSLGRAIIVHMAINSVSFIARSF